MKPTGRLTNIAPGHGGIERSPATLANHRFFDRSQAAMLRRAVKASLRFERQANGVQALVQVWTEGVGHRLPTGFVDRHLILVVEATNSSGASVAPSSGPKLPAFVGTGMAGRSGRLYARVLRDFEGHSPVPFWLAAPDPPLDTRLTPGKIDEMIFDYPASLAHLSLRVFYQRFWPEVARSKNWPDDHVVVLEQTFTPPTE